MKNKLKIFGSILFVILMMPIEIIISIFAGINNSLRVIVRLTEGKTFDEIAREQIEGYIKELGGDTKK